MADAAAPPPVPPRRISHRVFRVVYFGLLAVFVVSLIAAQAPMEGALAGIAAIPVVIAEASATAVILLTIFWFAFLSPRSIRQRGTILACIAIPLVLFVASIRDIEFTGDMAMDPVFRWEKLQSQVVEEYRAEHSLTGAVAAVSSITPEDMPAYRGANRDGVIIGPPLREDWSQQAPAPLWKHPIGEGYSSFAVVGDLLVTLEQRAAGEAVVGYRASDGAEQWVVQTSELFDETQGGPGPRTTPTIDGDRVYALGATGNLFCLNLADGKEVWRHNVLTENHLQNSMWGMTSCPLIIDDQVVVNVGGPSGNGLLSFDKVTGDARWQTAGITAQVSTTPVSTTAPAKGSDDHAQAAKGSALSGYASPVLAEIAGVRQILNFDGTGLRGHDPTNGEELWVYPFQNSPGINVAQPILLPEGDLLISASYGSGTVRLKVTHEGDDWKVSEVWPKPSFDLKAKMASMILYEGYVYGLDEGILVCLDPQTGKRTWKGGRYGHGQLLVTNDQLVILTEKGEAVLVKPNPKKLEEVARFQALPTDAKTWNPPSLAHGKLYVRNHKWMAAYDVEKKSVTVR
jgi:outer membrane protein assembly factor BamB